MTVSKILNKYGTSPRTLSLSQADFEFLMQHADEKEIMIALMTSDATLAQADALRGRVKQLHTA